MTVSSFSARMLVAAIALHLSAVGVARADVVTAWNVTIVNCVSANRPGPTSGLDIALAHGAMHDAVQANEGRFESYAYADATRLGLGTPEAAAAAAAYGVLAGLYGAGHACLSAVTLPVDAYPGDAGLATGAAAAAAFLPLYRSAFALPTDPFVGGTAPGEWRLTPGVAAGANTYLVYTQPFMLNRARQFRPEPPPPLDSEAYRRDYDEVKKYGSVNSPDRSIDQNDLIRFWGNFGGQWNGAIRLIADAHVPDVGDKARLFALASYANADALISVFETKYHYNFWRPITAIREGDNDGNPNTEGQAGWTPFLSTPAYPDHSSGANNATGAYTGILELFFGTDEFAFTVSSGAVGLLTNPRTYQRFSQAAQEVVDVRVLQGIHFRFADEAGRRQGNRVAHWVFQKFLRPLHGSKK